MSPIGAGLFASAILIVLASPVAAAELRLRSTRADSLAEASRLLAQGDSLTEKGSYDQAVAATQRSLTIRERALGPDHPEVAWPLNSLALALQKKGAFAQSESLYQRALTIREKATGREDSAYADVLQGLAEMYRTRSDLTRAEPLLQQTLSIREKVLGPEHSDVCITLNSLAGVYRSKGEAARAESLYHRAIAISEKTMGPEHRFTGSIVNNLAGMYRNQGEYARAESLYRRAMAIGEKALGPEHPDFASMLNNLALLLGSKGELAREEPLLQRALAIQEKALGADHPLVANTLSNLGVLYIQRNDLDRGERHLVRALEIREKKLGPGNPMVAITLLNLAQIQSQRGATAAAESLFLRTLSILEKAVGPNHVDVANTLSNLGKVLIKTGDYIRADSAFRRALDICLKALGPEHTHVGTILHNQADLAAARGDAVRAESLYVRSLAVFEKALGPDHPSVGTVVMDLAAFLVDQKDFARAQPLLERGERIEETNLSLFLDSGSEEQKRSSMGALSASTSALLSFHLQSEPAGSEAAALAFTTVLRRKGRVLDVSSASRRALRQSLAPEDRALLDELSAVRSRVAFRVLAGPGGRPAAVYRAELDSLRSKGERLEDAISRRSATFRAQVQPVTIERVQESIPAGAALVEIIQYRPKNHGSKPGTPRWARPRYAAYVLHPKGAVEWADLGDAASIDSLANRWRAVLAQSFGDMDRPLGRKLDERLISPLRPLLRNVRHVLVAPDGLLNLVPFAAMVDGKGRHLVERYTFTYLTSGRDLLRIAAVAETSAPVPFLVVASPSFDAAGEPLASAASTEVDSDLRRRSADMASLQFKPLPGTAAEGAALHQLMGGTLLEGERATEGALKTVHGPHVLHIATHGFFLPDEPDVELPEGAGREVARARALSREQPLLRSGLALAGANARRSNDEDGVLTSLEVSEMDLTGTELVVLSACETGVGDLASGEGVYGLRRAFAMAGAESQVMSLWKVADNATRDLMVSYYRRLGAGEGRSEALRQVQLEMLGVTKSRGPSTLGSGERAERRHPFYWASFIPVGSWTPLEQPSASR